MLEKSLLNIEQRKNILKEYLGYFFIGGLNEKLVDLYQSKMPEYKSVIASGPIKDLKLFGQYVLLAFGKKKFEVIYSSDLINQYFDKVDEESSGPSNSYEYVSSLLFVVHRKGTPKHKKINELVLDLINYREDHNKNTILLVEEIETLPLMREAKYLLIDSKESNTIYGNKFDL